jgi:GntR family transcriptional regulator
MTTQFRTIPKYIAISQEIIARINNGELALGGQVPSENELIATHSISNTTARKVLLELERGGWVTRIKGRGTFVRQSRVERTVNRILSFTRNMLESGRRPSTKLLGIKPIRQSRSFLLRGRTWTLPAPIFEVKRLRFADDVPMMVETRYVSMHFCPGLDHQDLEGSLYDIYESEYGLQLQQIDQQLSATVLQGEELALFDLTEQTPFFRVEGVTFLARELILEMEESLYRGDMYEFNITAIR